MLKANLKVILPACFFFAFQACHTKNGSTGQPVTPNLFVMVLGVAQDAGYPQAGCDKECCHQFYNDGHQAERVVSLGIVDKEVGKVWMIEATPDFKSQWHDLTAKPGLPKSVPDGIFLTHAHIGHYTGLMQLGRETMGASGVPVFAMPRMAIFLAENGPWSQLVALENIHLQKLTSDSTIQLSDNISVTPFLVPHRDEFSETVGYRIQSRSRSIVFIPDIDKWNKWDEDIRKIVASADAALLDATFYRNGEIARDMSEVPHPFVEESMALLGSLSESDRRKVHFIHFNHTNPLIWGVEEKREVESKGYSVSFDGQILAL